MKAVEIMNDTRQNKIYSTDVVQANVGQPWKISSNKQQTNLANKMIRDRSYDQRLKKGKTMDKNEQKDEGYIPSDNKEDAIHCK